MIVTIIDQGLSKRVLLFMAVAVAVAVSVIVSTVSTVTVTVIMTTVTVIVTMSKDGQLDDVEEETSPSSDHHEVFLDLRRVKKSQSSLIEQPNCQAPKEDNTKDSTEDLSTIVTVGQGLICWSQCHFD